MKKIAHFVMLILCAAVFSISADAEKFEYSFRKISPPGGFTYGAINSICEDSQGFIWFGTIHGLYKYNSADVKKYIYNPDDSTSISGNSIRTILCDSTGTIWIGTSQGICTYDRVNDQFNRLNFTVESGEMLGSDVRDIFMGEDGNIYFLSTIMLGRLNIKTKLFEKVINSPESEGFSSGAYDSSGRIWLGGTRGTVWQYRLFDRSFLQFCQHRQEAIQKILPDANRIWLGYQWVGVDRIDMNGDLSAHYGSNPEDQNKIHHNRVRDLYKGESGRIWISTYKGISIIDGENIINLASHEVSGLPYTSIYKIFRDSKDGIWIGTWSGGLAYRSRFDNHFVHVVKEHSDTEMEDEFVSSFIELEDGTILAGTEFGNLKKHQRGSNRMVNVAVTTDNGLKLENIKALLYDRENQTLWAGTYLNGLWYRKMGESVFRKLDKFENLRTSVYALEKSDSGLWIGTFGRGLYHYNIQSGLMTKYVTVAGDKKTISGNRIRSLCVSRDKSVFVGTDMGFCRFNPATGVATRLNPRKDSLNAGNSDEVYAIHEDGRGIIWIGTSGNGLYKYDPVKDIFESFRVKDGLAGDDVYGIQHDKKGIIWLSSDYGISSLDPIQKTIRNFDRQNELEGNQFNPGAVFMTGNGEILFGNTKGFTLFEPNEMRFNPIPPKVILTSLYINNLPFERQPKSDVLKKAFHGDGKLNLAYNQNTVTFSFVANNFLLPGKNRFKYRLVNYDKNWINAGTQNTATYTKIPPGDYTFEVIACNNDNIWNKIPTQLKIDIAPPLWLTWYAYLLYFLILLLIWLLFRKALAERQKIKKELMMERLMHESEAQVQEMKLQFFTNISHEFRTPLTLIASPANLLLEKFRLEPSVREHLLVMQRNSNRLLRLVNQLIDVRKIEKGKAILNLQKTDLVGLCKEIVSFYEMEAVDRQIHLVFFSDYESLPVLIDPDKMDKVFFNILSNAMKFTSENGMIRISLYTTHSSEFKDKGVRIGEAIDGKIVCIEFSDTGQGIDPEEIRTIFNRFSQGKSHQSAGTGIGLHMAFEYTKMHKGNICVISKPGEGSTFNICLPLLQEADTPGEKPIQVVPGIHLKPVAEPWSEPEYVNIKEKTYTILVIEDNYELRNYLKNFLSHEYKVVTAQNGKQGLETALTILPDVVIADIMMPLMDGLEVCRLLKNDLHSSHIPIILLTAFTENEKKIGGLKYGADAYITKPFDEKILLAQIENLIDSRAKLREIYSLSDTEWSKGMEVMFSDKMLIDKATTIVEQHLNDKNFVVDHLADHLGISASSLYRKLKVLTNQSPTEFVRYIRLKKAVKLMNDGNSNVDEIGFAVGFNSHSYFTSSFKKQYGRTPSEYLNDLKTKRS